MDGQLTFASVLLKGELDVTDVRGLTVSRQPGADQRHSLDPSPFLDFDVEVLPVFDFVRGLYDGGPICQAAVSIEQVRWIVDFRRVDAQVGIAKRRHPIADWHRVGVIIADEHDGRIWEQVDISMRASRDRRFDPQLLRGAIRGVVELEVQVGSFLELRV